MLENGKYPVRTLLDFQFYHLTFYVISKAAIYRLKITSKRQVTFPKDVMDALMLEPGDILEIRETPEGYALATPEVDMKKLFPLQPKIPLNASPLDIEEFREKGYEQSLRN